jgi:hypothetical protein
MSNMMPGDNSGAESRDHYADCRVNCQFAVGELAEGEECEWGHHNHECDCESCAEEWALLGLDD